jgi:uncharacterized membrane protein YtjA (UPF0391 family)
MHGASRWKGGEGSEPDGPWNNLTQLTHRNAPVNLARALQIFELTCAAIACRIRSYRFPALLNLSGYGPAVYDIRPQKELVMIRWSILFLVVALIAALFGFTTVAGTAIEAARILFFVFLVLFVVSLLVGGRRPRQLT